MQGCDSRFFHKMNKFKSQSVDLAPEEFYCLPKRDDFYRVIVDPSREQRILYLLSDALSYN